MCEPGNLSKTEQDSFRAEIQEANRLAEKTCRRNGVTLHRRVAMLRTGLEAEKHEET